MPEGFKTCATCRSDLPVAEFNGHKSSKDGLRSSCRECCKRLHQEWYARNADQQRSKRQLYYQNNRARENAAAVPRARAYNAAMSSRDEIELPESKLCSRCKRTKLGAAFAKNRSRKDGLQNTCMDCFRDRKYGLAPGEYDDMARLQGGVCAICAGSNPHEARLSVDHNHSSGMVRGLLCQNCNAALGMLREDPLLFERAVEYLKRG